ncbi:MAG TPA: hypothetical protein H9786_07705 [Candidatus Brachybacterium merdavium]|uniref:Uncharacterized protein n=1 Tax=Candidatus Brachybacterium merdavium TaxID=2838513 RepID=A0A9D2RPZ0_9MICO|nr:hypothetical protein [Candidatus Brachybacterium merdavium]
MHTGPQFTPPQQPHGPGGGRGGALLVGGIAFAIVFLMIVGLTVAYLVVRTSTSGPVGGGAATSESVTTGPASSGTTEPEETTTSEATEARCWSPEHERTSSNPSGRLRGGGLQFIPPAGFDNRSTDTWVNFLNDTQTAHAPVEGTWVSTLIVGKVEWQPGVEYPGEEEAAERLVECLFSNDHIWGDTSERALQEELTEPVTVAGMPGYRHRAVVTFGQHDLTRTDSTEIVAVVVATPEGPSAFISEIAVGVTEHEEGAEEAYASLTGI